MRLVSFLAGLNLLLAPLARAAGLPADATVNEAAPTQTLVPRVVINSGRLEWTPHGRNLTAWTTLSHEDKRSIPRPQRVELKPPLAGDAARGKTLAWEWCVACHQWPGDAWPGTVGNPLLHYRQYKHPDAAVYQQIFDARALNPDTIMPPYGAFGLLTEQDLRDLVAYLQSLD